MKLSFLLILALAFSSTAYAQRPEVRVDRESYVPAVVVTHANFDTMCKTFARKGARVATNGMVAFKPKPVPLSRKNFAGQVWVVDTDGPILEVASIELPESLQIIQGEIATSIIRGTCRVRDNPIFSTDDVIFVTAEKDEANALASALR